VVRWNTDKHYLAELAALGLAVVPGTFVEPGEEPLPMLREFLVAATADGRPIDEFVIKPAVGAGSIDTQRYARGQEFAAANHIARLLDADRSVLLQPYQASVDRDGETALIHYGGVFSHAIRKAPLLQADGASISHIGSPEAITPREPGADELAIAADVLAPTAQLLACLPRWRTPGSTWFATTRGGPGCSNWSCASRRCSSTTRRAVPSASCRCWPMPWPRRRKRKRSTASQSASDADVVDCA